MYICTYCGKESNTDRPSKAGKRHYHPECLRKSDAKHHAENNGPNWALAQSAKLLYGRHRIRKEAHGRYVTGDFTYEEQQAIEAHAGNESLKPVTIFSINRTTGSGQTLDINSKTIHLKSRDINPSKLHAEIQKFFETMFGAISESRRIDSLISKLALEIKPKLSAGEFDKAFGKSWRTRVRFGYEVGIVGLVPIGTEELQQLKDVGISYIVLDWKNKKIDFTNSWMTEPVKKILTNELS